jgi:excisionase family DNA binding protein
MPSVSTISPDLDAPPLRYLTVSEAASMLGLSPTSVQMLVERGLLKAWRTAGGHRRIHPDSVRDLLAQRMAAPATEADTNGTAAAAHVAPDSPLDVVVAEDDEFLIRLYQTRLAAAGFPVAPRFARDGVQALLAIGAQLPDALVLDVNMPGLNGRDALTALRHDSRTARLPVFIVTGLAQDDVDKLLPLPAGVALMGKPVPFERLLGNLEALFLLRTLHSG